MERFNQCGDGSCEVTGNTKAPNTGGNQNGSTRVTLSLAEHDAQDRRIAAVAETLGGKAF
jgi:hypothetical protein